MGRVVEPTAGRGQSRGPAPSWAGSKAALLVAGLLWLSLACSAPDRPPLLGGSTGPLPASADGRLVGAPCPMIMPTEAHVECGRIRVPESRSGRSQREITLPVVVFRSTHPGASVRSPVVYLEGGPGGHAIFTVVTAFNSLFRAMTSERDLIVFDQRGTGFAEPQLNCPDIKKAGGNLPALDVESVGGCRSDLARVADLDSYDTQENAADVEALRVSLGHGKWDLLGVSYGARLALEVMRRHPEGLRTVILDSVLPPDVDSIAAFAPNYKRALDTIFRTCQSQAACRLAYPELEKTFYAMLASYDKDPIPLEGDGTGVDGNRIARFLFGALYDIEAVSLMPEIISLLSERDPSMVQMLSDLATSKGASGGLSTGMYLSVSCSDVVPLSSVERVQASSTGLPAPLVSALNPLEFFEVCAQWKVEPAGALGTGAVQSAIPSLVLNGAFDPITPPEWGAQVSLGLPASHRLVFQAASHAVLLTGCFQAMANAFWASPAGNPASACPGRDTPLVMEVATERLGPGTGLAATGPRTGRNTAARAHDALRRNALGPRWPFLPPVPW